jgi:hypothetical protein
MYNKMSSECRRSLKRQFDFSILELDQIEKFISSNMDKSAADILGTLMENADLNDRQKVMVSYTLGASVGAEGAMQKFEDSQVAKVDQFVNMKIGQGG